MISNFHKRRNKWSGQNKVYNFVHVTRLMNLSSFLQQTSFHQDRDIQLSQTQGHTNGPMEYGLQETAFIGTHTWMDGQRECELPEKTFTETGAWRCTNGRGTFYRDRDFQMVRWKGDFKRQFLQRQGRTDGWKAATVLSGRLACGIKANHHT